MRIAASGGESGVEVVVESGEPVVVALGDASPRTVEPWVVRASDDVRGRSMKLTHGILLTEEGWRALHEELRSLRGLRRSQVDEYMDLARAAEPGESSARYVPNDIALLDQRIAHLEEVLAKAVPVRAAEREPGRVGVGSSVVVRWEDDDEEERFTIVGPPEVDLQVGRISYESPVGRALVGKHQDDWVEVRTPTGSRRAHVLAVD